MAAETRDAVRLREIARQLQPLNPRGKTRTLTAGVARDLLHELQGIADRIERGCPRQHIESDNERSWLSSRNH